MVGFGWLSVCLGFVLGEAMRMGFAWGVIFRVWDFAVSGGVNLWFPRFRGDLLTDRG